jgi:hypothetical protein
MLDLIDRLKSARILYNTDGGGAVIKVFVRYLLRNVCELILSPICAVKIRQLKVKDAKGLFDFAFSVCSGLIKPYQERTEMIEFLNILRIKPPRSILEIGTAKGGTLFLLCRSAT